MRECRIEILMTTYNGAAYLKEQLDSILAQTYRNWHLTVSDDGSTDATVSIIQAYERAHPDKIRRMEEGSRRPGFHETAGALRYRRGIL